MPATTTLPETMTLAEMREHYPNHWLLIGDPVSIPPEGLRSGKLLYADEDRDALYDVALRHPDGDFAVVCTKPTPPGIEFVL